MLGVSLSDGNGLVQGGGSTARDGSVIFFKILINCDGSVITTF